MTEEERAALFRAQAENRARWRQQRVAALAGDPLAAERVRAGFEALRPSPLDAWDIPEPADPPMPSWAGRVPPDIELPEHLKARTRPGAAHR